MMRSLVAIPQAFASEFATNVLKSLIATWACVPSLWAIGRSSPNGWGIPRQCVTQATPA
jgi:hypothetical protein